MKRAWNVRRDSEFAIRELVRIFHSLIFVSCVSPTIHNTCACLQNLQADLRIGFTTFQALFEFQWMNVVFLAVACYTTHIVHTNERISFNWIKWETRVNSLDDFEKVLCLSLYDVCFSSLLGRSSVSLKIKLIWSVTSQCGVFAQEWKSQIFVTRALEHFR